MGAPGAGALMKFLTWWNSYTQLFMLSLEYKCMHHGQSTRLPHHLPIPLKCSTFFVTDVDECALALHNCHSNASIPLEAFPVSVDHSTRVMGLLAKVCDS